MQLYFLIVDAQIDIMQIKMQIVYYHLRVRLHEHTMFAKFQMETQSPFAIAFPMSYNPVISK